MKWWKRKRKDPWHGWRLDTRPSRDELRAWLKARRKRVW